MVGLSLASLAAAQSPSVLYTWDHGFGEAPGPNTETWVPHFGAQAVSLSNAIDGELTVTELSGGVGDWAISESFNRIRESDNPLDIIGLDLTGLDSIEIDIAHTGANTYGGQIYLQVPNTSSGGCCQFRAAPISVAPGGIQTVSIPLAGTLLNDYEQAWIQQVGVQIFDHSWDAGSGAVTWTIQEIRSAGTPLEERFLSPHSALGDLDGAVVKFDAAAVTGGADDTQNGLSAVATEGVHALRWVDLGGGPGAAIAWGNGRDGLLAVDYQTRPTDLSNYDYVTVRIKAQPGSGADPTVGVEFYAQNIIAPGNEFSYQTPGTIQLPVDNTFHELTFSLAGLSGMQKVQWHGINLAPHAGNMAMFVDYVRFWQIPEPSSLAVVMIGLVGACASWRRR
jgi:hypothetical protein